MKKLKFEKVSDKLTNEEMDILKGGYTPQKGDTYGGDTYGNGAWQGDANGDKNAICYANHAWYDC